MTSKDVGGERWLRVEGQTAGRRRHDHVEQLGRYVDGLRGQRDRLAPAQAQRLAVLELAVELLERQLGIATRHEGHEAAVGVARLVLFCARPL